MILIIAFLLSFSSCLDSVVVGAAYGMKRIKIGIASNLIIASITTLGTFLSMAFGKQFAAILPSSVANYIGAAVLFLLGLSFIIQGVIILRKKVDGMTAFALKSDSDHSGHIGKRESVIVALGLTLNNIAVGVAASLAGVNIILASLFTLILSIASLYLGIYLGKNFIGKALGKYAPLIAGVILVILSISQILI